MNLIFKNGKLNAKYSKPSQLLQACMENVAEKQNALLKKYNLDQMAGFEINEDRGTLQITLKDNTVHEFDVVPVGVWNARTGQWVWSWANGEKGAIFYSRAAALKGLQNIISATDFSEPVITCDGHRSQALSFLSVEYLGGIGRFIAPESDFRLHLILMKHHE